MKNNIAVVFPGQGSQYNGMLAKLAQQSSIVTQLFTQASEVFGEDLWHLAQHGPEEQLNSTKYTQPLMLCAGVACWQYWQEQKHWQASFFAGHSLGEYAALVCAQALSFKDAVHLVIERAQLMQSAVPEGKGAMAAIVGLDAETVLSICQQAKSEGEVAPANYNSPGQVVVAGLTIPVERVIQMAKAAGAKIAKRLAVSVPSHSPLMLNAAQQFAATLQNVAIASPRVPVLHNFDVAVHTHPDEIRTALVKQIYSPVRWVETIEYFIAQGVHTVVECGPNKVLTGLNKRINAKIQTLSVCEPEEFIAVEQLIKKEDTYV